MRTRESVTRIPILGLLTWRPMSAYDIKVNIADGLGNFWNESFGQLYPELRRLAAEGLIEVAPDQPTGGRNKKLWQITDAGRRALADWLARAPHARPQRNELLLKVFFAPEGNPAVILDHCRQLRAAIVERLARYETIQARMTGMIGTRPKASYWRMTVRYGIELAQAELRWCDSAIAELETLISHPEKEKSHDTHPLHSD